MQTNRGLVKMIIVFFIVLIILAALGLNLRNIVNSPIFQDNWNFIKTSAVMVWENYIKVPLTYIIEKLFLPLIWNPAVEKATGTSSTTLQANHQ